MRIAFNGVGCGWGNTGGTQSVFRMADALRELGVDVQLWADMPNKFTWFSPRTPLITTDMASAPETDVLISTGVVTVKNTWKFSRKRVGIQWARGYESWAMPENKLKARYALDLPLWANSTCLAQRIQRVSGKDVDVQYCGIPLDEFYPTESTDEFTVGALWSDKPAKKAKGVFDLMGRPELSDVQWRLFGETELRDTGTNMRFRRRPDRETKRGIYSECDVWVTTSVNEGLHIPPMEAALCGAAVVSRSGLSAGTADYCVDGVSGRTYETLEQAVDAIQMLRDPDIRREFSQLAQERIIRDIGSVEENARRMMKRIEGLL